jgi:hypothetical protein
MESKLLTKNELIKLLPELINLFKLSFGLDISEEYLKWRYLENPINDLIVSVVLDNQKLVHSRASIPCVMHLNGEEIKTITMTNAMVHPLYRRKGVFSKGRFFGEYVVQMGYRLVWAFPNNLTHRLSVTSLGFRDVYEIPTMQLDLDSPCKPRLAACETDHQFKMDYSELYKSSSLNFVIKSEAYLKWRYFKNPLDDYFNFVLHRNKKVSSYLVVKLFKNRLNIIDFQVSDPEEGDFLLETSINYAHSLNMDMVTAWLPRHTIIHSLAEKRGFRNNAPITYFCIRELTDELVVSSDYGDWFIQMGDFYSY